MQLLSREATENSPASDCLLLGLGLIGASVSRQLRDSGYAVELRADAHWQDPAKRIETFDQLARHLEDQDHGLHVAWCAGSGSFAADAQMLQPESSAFDDLLAMTQRVAQSRPVTIHFISSAGALFERQVGVDRHSQPRSSSAYGDMKLRQERQLHALAGDGGPAARIYRPSTVYGSHAFHRRAGLVSHVMWNALRREPTFLEANVHALRDFVHHDDVARYLVRAMAEPGAGTEPVAHLVSAKPSSIREVFRRIERLVGRSVYYRLGSGAGNDANITFSADLRPPDWNPVPLDVGLADVWRETRKTFLTEAEARD